MNLVSISDLSKRDVLSIWSLVNQNEVAVNLAGLVAWSFEGNGIRTRTTFLEAFRQLGLTYIELLNLLKTSERVTDLAGYLDDYYDLYVVRESNHKRLNEFALASKRPVINAMSQEEHPCEVLTDAYFIQSSIGKLEDIKVGLWGPPTNVFKSWHNLAQVFNFKIHHFCASEFHAQKENVTWHNSASERIDILITDGWPKAYQDEGWSLTFETMEGLGQPKLLPTPPFTIGNELAFDPVKSNQFVGYGQKTLLLHVQRAIVRYLLES